jgi:hypothetical protein
MAKPTTREEFKQYCLRRLGAPVINIELSDDQIEDRIDDALAFWNDYYYDGSELVYVKHQLSALDVSNGYITVPASLIGVVRIFELSSSITTGGDMFNITYQYVLNNVSDLTNGSIQNYWMTMQNLRFIQEWLIGMPMIRYNRHANIVHLDMSTSRLREGQFIIVEAYAPLDETNPDIWGDRWLQKYATCLIKLNWGSVLTKYTNSQLVSGMTFNGDKIYDEASEEKKILEAEAIEKMQPLIYNFSG